MRYEPPPCEPGYELIGRIPRCVDVPNAVQFDGPLPTCERRQCGVPRKPENGVLGKFKRKRFGDTCTLTCDEGYMSPKDAALTAEITCDDWNTTGKVDWTGNFKCTPGQCHDGKVDLLPGGVTLPGECSKTLDFGKFCVATCADGATVAGRRDCIGGTCAMDVTYACAVTPEGLYRLVPQTQVCEPQACARPSEWLDFNGAAPKIASGEGCVNSEPVPSGAICEFICPPGSKPSPAIAHFTCDSSVLTGCTDASCSNETYTDLLPGCYDETVEMEVVPVAQSEVRAEVLSDIARDLEENAEKTQTAFKAGLEKELSMPVTTTGLTVDSVRLRRLQGDSLVIVEFYVSGPIEAAMAAVGALAEVESETLLDGINDALAAEFGEDVYISSALVKEPEQAMVSMAVVVETPPPTPEPATTTPPPNPFPTGPVVGGSVAGVILLGGAAWYFLKMKKGESGAEEEALIEEEDAPELEVRGDLQ
jgi:hypothetical protein